MFLLSREMRVGDHLGIEISGEDIFNFFGLNDVFRDGVGQFSPVSEEIIGDIVIVLINTSDFASFFGVSGELSIFGGFRSAFGNIIVLSGTEDLAPVS